VKFSEVVAHDISIGSTTYNIPKESSENPLSNGTNLASNLSTLSKVMSSAVSRSSRKNPEKLLILNQ
jgi:hypothetical protein